MTFERKDRDPQDEGKLNRRTTIMIRGLPLEIYEYASAAAKRHPALTTVNSQYLDMMMRGYLERLQHDYNEQNRLIELKRGPKGL